MSDEAGSGSAGPHPYTVDVYLVGAEPYPCIVCGQQRQAPIHEQGSARDSGGSET